MFVDLEGTGIETQGKHCRKKLRIGKRMLSCAKPCVGSLKKAKERSRRSGQQYPMLVKNNKIRSIVTLLTLVVSVKPLSEP